MEWLLSDRGGRVPFTCAAGCKMPCITLGDLCAPRGPLEAAAGTGWRGGAPPCDGGPQGSGDSVLGIVSGLHTLAFLPRASEVLAVLLMASSAQGSAKCAFCPEMGKGKKSHGFFFFFLSSFCLDVRENCSFPAAGSWRWAEVTTRAVHHDGSIWGEKLQGKVVGTLCSFDLLPSPLPFFLFFPGCGSR